MNSLDAWYRVPCYGCSTDGLLCPDPDRSSVPEEWDDVHEPMEAWVAPLSLLQRLDTGGPGPRLRQLQY
jgi:hypothetical protein